MRLALPVSALALGGLGLLNLAAYRQARAMTRFTGDGPRTPPPEALGRLGRAAVLLAGVRAPRPRNARTPADVGLGYETHAVEVRPGLSLEVWLVRHPRAVGTVLLFHGYAASKDQLLEAARAFVSLGSNALLVDFRGSGGSGGDRTSIGYHEAEDVAVFPGVGHGVVGATALAAWAAAVGAFLRDLPRIDTTSRKDPVPLDPPPAAR